MNQGNWPNNDYQIGLSFITDHEDKAVSNTILETENDVTAILPSGLHLYGAGFYGIFMLAPIVLFMLIITYFLFFILTAHSFAFQTQMFFFVVGFSLLWGLTKALKLLISSRDLFRRKYFTTLGKQGISANYSKLHFPLQSKVAIEWDQIATIRSYSSFFFPGLLSGILKTTIIEITSRDGTALKIPFYSTDEQMISQKILDLIHKKRNN